MVQGKELYFKVKLHFLAAKISLTKKFTNCPQQKLTLAHEHSNSEQEKIMLINHTVQIKTE